MVRFDLNGLRTDIKLDLVEKYLGSMQKTGEVSKVLLWMQSVRLRIESTPEIKLTVRKWSLSEFKNSSSAYEIVFMLHLLLSGGQTWD